MIHFATLGIADVEVQTMVSDGEALISEAGVLGLLVGPHAQDEDIARDFRHVIFYSGEGRRWNPCGLRQRMARRYWATGLMTC